MNTKIVNVNYILDSSKIYNEYINEKFNLVFSSHNIEHQPDIITHLNNVESILVDGGYYCIICPDFRFIFDMYRNPTTIPDVLNAYLRKDKTPQFITQMEHLFISGQTPNKANINRISWDMTSNQDRLLTQNKLINKDFNLSFEEIKNYYNTTKYNDCHVGKFYYENFIDILNYLYKIDLTKFKIDFIHVSTNEEYCYEFGIILKKCINVAED
jgi:hypothetical protein